ncbi:hypothetical protein FE257_010427 [Aspergillus nanangensis]|uniref:Uncharacterized protein n=1 Tax=Aspergillus nanangensis TaxID=2582783 RepID=A0AAD4GT86_ASPNN|nr:hypothetical protein FE257_010427 [Aspergillus nanangensis]
MFSRPVLFAALACASLSFASPAKNVARRSFAPTAGSTVVSIGQNYDDEWHAFADSVKTPSGISFYGNIYDGALNSDSQTLLADYAGSQNGFVEIGLSWKDDMTSHGYTIYQGAQLCQDIAGGKYDASLNQLGSYLAQFSNVKYLLRVDYEVSGNLHANTNPNGFDSATFDLTAYPAAFAHVRSVILGLVSNVEFVFHPVRGSASQLYPGDDVVDWQGFSIFNNDVCLAVGSTTNCQGDQLDPNVLKDIQFATKPKIVSESGAQPPASADPAAFIDYLDRVRSMVETYDFAGWFYINSLWTAHGWDGSVWGDSRIEANAQVLDWYQQNIVANPRYVFAE